MSVHSGKKRVISGLQCWAASEAQSAGGVRVSLSPGQTASIESSGNESFALKCGDHAETLSSLAKQQFALR